MANVANGARDYTAPNGLRYPGQDPEQGAYANIPGGYPTLRYIRKRRGQIKNSNIGQWGENYPQGEPSATPTPSGGGGPGTGAGAGGSGLGYVMQPGGLSTGAGGSVGGSGAFGQYFYAAPLAGNEYLKVLPAIIPGPSHMQF